ncbi:hypothetical protein HRI_000681700 [Hibiscus trionum]|uniref:Uncharacterized protein n=1 Tax=Hibiscus trionum TaxID=183268 RepID=A0A9W7H2Z0_HIBTR|nr:hypothetical protein HRI_000681700 [Hibiscus trionum]
MSAEHLLLTVDDASGVMKFEIRHLRKVSDDEIRDSPSQESIGCGRSILNGINSTESAVGASASVDTVFLDGRDIVDFGVLGLRRKVGMLFQLPTLFQAKHPMAQRFLQLTS